MSVLSLKSDLRVEIKFGDENISLPQNSPFADWREARRYAGPLPFTFTYNKITKEMLIIEGVREDWVPKPVEVLKNEIGFLKSKNFKGLVLANAFLIENIPYYWKKGKKELWKR